jgi:hypothetical protein
MADPEKDIRLFFRAASARLEAARFLLENGYYVDSTYLAGYVIECSLKAVILRRTPRVEHAPIMAKLTQAGAKGHNFEFLKQMFKERIGKLSSRDNELFGTLSNSFKVVSSWSTDLRYTAGRGKHAEAERFFQAAADIHDWCQRG